MNVPPVDTLALPLLSLLLACGPAPTATVAPRPQALVSRTDLEPDPSPSTAAPVEDTPAVETTPAEPVPIPLRVQSTGPLSAEQLEILHGSPEDEVPERRNGILRKHEDEHYVTSNEKTLDLFHRAIADVGGGYLGVGTDQGYLLVDWMRPAIAWFIDYDAEVMSVHELYRRFLLAADTPDQFLALWTSDGRDRALALLGADTDPAQAEQLTVIWESYHQEIRRRLGKVAARMARKRIPCYLVDPDRYEHLRRMVQHGRVRPMLANLLDEEAVTGIAEAARTLEVPIRVLYLSNAEQYWKRYSPQYRLNIAELPLDDEAVVLRTQLRGSIDKDFHYGTQPAANYVEWLSAPYVRNVYDITGRPEADKGRLSFFHTQGDPERSWVGRRWRAAEASRSAQAPGRQPPG